MHLVLLVVLAMQSLGTASDGPPEGRLCLRDPGALMVAERCRSVEGSSFAVEPDPEERVFGWISSDRSTIALGVVPAGADIVTLPEGPAVMNLEIEGSEDREWPQTTRLAIGPRETPGQWQIELSAFDVERLREVLVPFGTWDVRVKAERHAVTALAPTRVLEPLDLGVITLKPLPQIRGTVIDREGKFLPTVVMIGNEGELLATSDIFGEIFYEAPCTERANCILPERFRIEYPGTAPVWFAVTNRERDLDVDTLRLAEGGTLQVELDRGTVKTTLVVEILDDPTAQIPAPAYGPKTGPNEIFHRLLLRREAPDLFSPQTSFPPIDSAELTEDESSVRFENLPEGQLRLVVRGSEQGEYLSRFFDVASEETLEMEIAIQPTELTIELSDDAKEIEGVPVQITQQDLPRHVVQTPPTDATGKSIITIWEKGRHTAHVANRNIRAGTRFEIVDQTTQTVAIRVTPASISGRVVEGATVKPVAGLTLLFENLLYPGDLPLAALTDDDGHFEIERAMPGSYSVEIHAEEFLPTEMTRQIDAGNNDLEDIRLGRGALYRVKVVWEDGTPIPGAVYLERSQLYGQHVADENGEITFRRSIPRHPVPFWIVPVEGSLARGERWFDQEITIRVQRPGETLVLDFENRDEEPVNFAHVNLAWDIYRVPREIRIAIESIQNKRFRSGASSRLTLEGMPPGRYTFWAIRDVADTPWLPDWPRPPFTTVHYSGMDQRATVTVQEPPENR